MPNIDTYGFDLNQIIADAKANGNEAFAEVCEEKLAELKKAAENVQALYSAVAQKWTTTGKDAWHIDAEYAKGLMI